MARGKPSNTRSLRQLGNVQCINKRLSPSLEKHLARRCSIRAPKPVISMKPVVYATECSPTCGLARPSSTVRSVNY